MKPLTEAGIKTRLIGLCDDVFLSKLTEVAKLYGWQGDYVEVYSFVEYLYNIKNKECPNLNPYEIRE